jgi:EAL domain-containing protein (putative c-di-GMP-specific phosphodiesterase class I)
VLELTDLGSTNGTYVNGVRIGRPQRLTEGDLVQIANVAFRVARTVDPAAENVQTVSADTCAQALTLVRFDKLLSDCAVSAHFQPVVELEHDAPIGFEALGRSEVVDLETPQALFAAALHLGVEAQLSRLLRSAATIEAAELPPPGHVFLNSHPAELGNVDELARSLWELRQLAPHRPMTLEIHESTLTSAPAMLELRARLADLNIGLAYDDFGAGQARLVELAEVRPNYLKFDLRLTQGIAQAPAPRQQMLEGLVRMARELEVQPLAEGLETRADADACRQLGFALAQGYLFGRPAPAGAWSSAADLCAGR